MSIYIAFTTRHLTLALPQYQLVMYKVCVYLQCKVVC